MQDTIQNRTIFCKDNIDILQGINSNSIDLIYCDPPFNKKKEFTAPIGSSAEGASFKDWFRLEDIKEEWVESIQQDNEKLHNFLLGIKNIDGRNSYNFCYIAYMAVRLIECHRILKDTGSLYLHCDPTMSHYLKITLDCIFGDNNFQNEIIWQRASGRAKGSQHKSKSFGQDTDTILFYGVTNDITYKEQYINDDNSMKKFKHADADGRLYKTDVPIFCSPSMGARPNLCYEYKGYKNPHPSGWRVSKEKLQELDNQGYIIWEKDGKPLKTPLRKTYLDEYEGKPIGSLWADIANVVGGASHTGYPTQKPIELLKRIISASTNENDIILDPFCGCATTCVAAEQLNRQWIGIDISMKAYELVKQRLTKEAADETDLLKYQNEIHGKTDAPKRTDQGQDYQLKKYVYVISNQAYPNEYKVGIASNLKNRLNSYQTSDPNRGYQIEHDVYTHLFKELEKHIHDKFLNRHEWVQADLKDIKKTIKDFLS